MKMKGISYLQVTPLWPQANGLVESFMKPLTKTVGGARLEGRDWRPALYLFLLIYRCTPHSTTPGCLTSRAVVQQISLQWSTCRRNFKQPLHGIAPKSSHPGSAAQG